MEYSISEGSHFVDVQLDRKHTFICNLQDVVMASDSIVFSHVDVNVKVLTALPIECSVDGRSGSITLKGNPNGGIVELDISKGRWVVKPAVFVGCFDKMDIKPYPVKGIKAPSHFKTYIMHGPGPCLLGGWGSIREIELRHGEEIKINRDNILAFESTVSIESVIEKARVGKYLSHTMSFFRVKGPGRLIMQSNARGPLQDPNGAVFVTTMVPITNPN